MPCVSWPAGPWKAAGDRWGPAPAERGRGPGQPAGAPRGHRRRPWRLRPLEPEACRRLACDGAVTRVVVTRQPGRQDDPSGHDPSTGQPTGPADSHDPTGLAENQDGPGGCSCPDAGPVVPDPSRVEGASGLAGWLQAAMTRLPSILGGARSHPLDVGRTSRVVTPTQRSALAVRDGGCVVPGCSRPLVWCEAHHLWHWLDGGPTDLANLVLLCRAHHRAVHEGGWRLQRHPDGGVTATPPHRRPRTAASPATGSRIAHGRPVSGQGMAPDHPGHRASPGHGARTTPGHNAWGGHGARPPGPPCQASEWGPTTQSHRARCVHGAQRAPPPDPAA
jgi:HNH endonuclease